MTTYYVDANNGNNSNNGLGPDASHATNKPWLTIAKALGASGIASGDTVYLAPGTYREVVTVAMTSPVAETSVLADPANAQGFKTSAGALVSPGDVVWTAYTTADTSAPVATTLLNLAGRDFLTFEGLIMVGGSTDPSCVSGITTNAVSITFRQCTFIGISSGNNLVSYTGLANVASNWLIDRCLFAGMSNVAVLVTLPTSGSADYDTNFVIQNCMIYGAHANSVLIQASGALASKGGGVDVLNSTIKTRGGMVVSGANIATSVPCTAYNNIIITGSVACLNANTLGQIVEDYNMLASGTPRTNVSTGANSKVAPNYALMLEFGQAAQSGRRVRPFMMPTASSPFLGFGNQAGAPSVDSLNRPRPAGGASTSNSIGALERHDTGSKETSVVDAGSTAVKLTGPGDHDLTVPVDATSTTITVRVRYDTNHGTTNKPQAKIMGGSEIGVSDETQTAAAGVDTWETLTFSGFTPTAKGFVTLRLISRAAAGTGIAYFDTVTGGASGSQGLDYFRRGEPLDAAVASAAGVGGAAGKPVSSSSRYIF